MHCAQPFAFAQTSSCSKKPQNAFSQAHIPEGITSTIPTSQQLNFNITNQHTKPRAQQVRKVNPPRAQPLRATICVCANTVVLKTPQNAYPQKAQIPTCIKSTIPTSQQLNLTVHWPTNTQSHAHSRYARPIPPRVNPLRITMSVFANIPRSKLPQNALSQAQVPTQIQQQLQPPSNPTWPTEFKIMHRHQLR